MKQCIYLNKLKIKLKKIIAKEEVGRIHRKSEGNLLKNGNYIKLHEEGVQNYKEIKIYKIVMQINLLIIISVNKLLI